MSKPALKKNHWTSRVNEVSVSKDARGELNVPLRGGAENGEFAYIGPLNHNAVVYKSGKLGEGELLLEVENLSISGLPLYDIYTVIKNCKGAVRFKTVRQGKTKGEAAKLLRFHWCAFNGFCAKFDFLLSWFLQLHLNGNFWFIEVNLQLK